MRKLTTCLLWAYALLTAYIVLVVYLGGAVHRAITPFVTLVSFAFAVLHSGQRLGWKKTGLFIGLTFGVSLLFESLGVATGWVYGPYHYSDKLGPKFLGLVPYLIPLAWYMMVYPSFLMAVGLVPVTHKRWVWGLSVAAMGAVMMTAWDLVMDPIMSLGGHWVWEVTGEYFGIPLQNFTGWWLTTFITLGLFIGLGGIQPAISGGIGGRFDRQAILSYTVSGLGNVLTGMKTGLGGPALVGFFAMLPWAAMSWWKTTPIE